MKNRGMIKVRIRHKQNGKDTGFDYRDRSIAENPTPKLDRFLKDDLKEATNIDSMQTPSTESFQYIIAEDEST